MLILVDDVMFIIDMWFLMFDDDYIMWVWDINIGLEENIYERENKFLNF